jgi:hypothetical protein
VASENLYKQPSSRSRMKEELRSIVSVFRHGDRSPKLKLKFKSTQPKFIELFTNPKDN